MDPIRILIVEDSESLRILLRIILDKSGLPVQIEEATDGRKGFLEICKGDFDLVLCDLRMPKWDGLTAIKAAHQIVPAIPFIVLSGSILDSDREAFKALPNVVDVMEKPVDSDKLIQTIRDVMGRKRDAK